MDIGGFTGGPSVGLYAKWIQLGAFNPYFRNHTAVNTKSSEPWTYGEEVTEISRNYISLRYKLLPYLYSTFNTSVTSGLPVVRSLAIDNTFDPKIYDTQFQNEFLFGQAFLVAPFESTKDFGNIYFPKGNWYNLYTGEKQVGNSEKIIRLSLNKMPVYVKESSIVPMQSLIQTTAEQPTDTLIINIFKGNINNSFVYYEDDGESYNYEKGDFYKRTISYNASNKSIVFDKVEGSFKSKFKFIKLMFHGFDANDKINAGKTLQQDFASFLTPISKFDPQGSVNSVEGYKVQSVVIGNDAKRFEIKY
jgi:alpha-glucosidase